MNGAQAIVCRTCWTEVIAANLMHSKTNGWFVNTRIVIENWIVEFSRQNFIFEWKPKNRMTEEKPTAIRSSSSSNNNEKSERNNSLELEKNA